MQVGTRRSPHMCNSPAGLLIARILDVTLRNFFVVYLAATCLVCLNQPADQRRAINCVVGAAADPVVCYSMGGNTSRNGDACLCV